MGFDWFNFFTYKILKMDEITVCAERNASVEFRIYYLPFIRVKLCSNFVKIILNDNLISKIKMRANQRSYTSVGNLPCSITWPANWVWSFIHDYSQLTHWMRLILTLLDSKNCDLLIGQIIFFFITAWNWNFISKHPNERWHQLVAISRISAQRPQPQIHYSNSSSVQRRTTLLTISRVLPFWSWYN